MLRGYPSGVLGCLEAPTEEEDLMSRRFLLVDLTPATRDLFRAFRDASRVITPLADASHVKHHLLQDAFRELDWAKAEGSTTDISRAQDRKDAAMESYQKSNAEFNEAVRKATEAFQAAQPAMESEGYPVAWWNHGNMRLPAGVESPGAHRRRKRA